MLQFFAHKAWVDAMLTFIGCLLSHLVLSECCGLGLQGAEDGKELLEVEQPVAVHLLAGGVNLHTGYLHTVGTQLTCAEPFN